MSVLTEVLKLFKYDPATDGDMTFNIGQCMNDNWDKLDAAILLAIAAAGAYNPEESYAVGDYCTYKGKLHKCSTAIPTGETWTEAHWTTTTVAAELAELSSQLSNLIADHGIKTYRDYTQIGLSGSEITIAQIFESLPAGSTLYANNTATSCLTSTERPTVTVYGFLIARKVSSAFAIMEWHCPSNDDGSVIGNYTSAYRTVSSPSWSGWALEPTATPPQEFDLPLLDGWYTNYRVKYRKTQEGLVVVNAILVLSEGYSASDNTQIAVLPEGFRPATSFMYPVSVQDGSTRASAIVQIGTSGTIIYYGDSNTTAVFRIYLNAAFFATS